MLAAVVAVVGLLLIYLALHKPRPKLPPGPPGLPILGNTHQLDKKAPYLTITEWSEKYGNVFTFKNFTQNVVVLNDYKTIHEALVVRSSDFAGRAPNYRASTMFKYCSDIVFADFTPKWIYTKKLSMTSLKSYGDGLANLEEISRDLISDMLKDLEKKAGHGTPVDMKSTVHACTGGIVSSVLWGHKLKPEELRAILDVERLSLEFLDPNGRAGELEMFPFLRYLPSQNKKLLYAVRDAFHNCYPAKNEESRAQCDGREPACMMEAIITQQQREVKEKGQPVLTKGDVDAVSINVIEAGTLTTSTTMSILTAVLVNKPEIQTRMRSDIQTVIGNRLPRLKDRSSLPYVEASILESLRYSSILPLLIPHTATTDTTMDGYDIPKGTMVMVNAWKLHHSEKYWDEPWEFRPERFLSDDGTLVPPDHINRKRLMPFGAGRRVCLGEVLARNRLFLLLVAIIQRFVIHPESEDKLPDYDPRGYDTGLVIAPKPFNVRLVTID